MPSGVPRHDAVRTGIIIDFVPRVHPRTAPVDVHGLVVSPAQVQEERSKDQEDP